jgi:hypothetical protein
MQIALGVTTYKGKPLDSPLDVDIKIIENPSPELYAYLTKLKAIKSDYVVKIH